MEDIKQHLNDLVLGDHDREYTEIVTNKIINEIILPLVKKAFESGETFKEIMLTEYLEKDHAEDFDQWVSNNLK